MAVVLSQLTVDQPQAISKQINYIKHLLSNGNIIQQVFFYGPAVKQMHCAYREIADQWLKLKLPLGVCANSAQKYGVYDQSLAQENNSAITICSGVAMGSLTQFFSLAATVPEHETPLLFVDCQHNFSFESAGLDDMLSFCFLAAGLDWQVTVVFEGKGVIFYNKHRAYIDELFQLNDIYQVFLESDGEQYQMQRDKANLLASF